MNTKAALQDTFGRKVTYVRISVTDRCDFRCIYCMAEEMTFLPKSKVLSLEELAGVARSFRNLGVDKLRITGGEPLIRRDVIQLFNQLGKLNFNDLSLTTNGARLNRFAQPLVDAGVHRVNISLDTLKADRFKAMTRTGNLSDVLLGIRCAQKAGFKRIKLNAVIMQNHNADEILDLTRFALDNQIDISFIEEMPLGQVSTHNRSKEFLSSQHIRDRLSQHYSLSPSKETSNGPSRYWRITGSENRIGFISPHSHNFCESCNRVRVSAEGRLLLCLGNEHSIDLRKVLRSTSGDTREQALEAAIQGAMFLKPKQHNFTHDDAPQILRFMNTTGG